MMISKHSVKNRRSNFLAGLLLLLTACTKTVTNPYPAESQSRILSYTIVNAQTPIKGVVDDNDHTITVYLPPTLYLTLLEPQITLPEGATVSPASGIFIEDMMDYFAKGRSIQYTVTGKDKTTTTYTLKVISLQPDLAFEEITTDPANPETFNHATSWYQNSLTLYPTRYFEFTLLSVLKASLIAENGTEYPFINDQGFKVNIGTRIDASLSAIAGYASGVTNAPPAGLYKIKVQYYSKITILKNPIKIVYE